MSEMPMKPMTTPINKIERRNKTVRHKKRNKVFSPGDSPELGSIGERKGREWVVEWLLQNHRATFGLMRLQLLFVSGQRKRAGDGAL
jgi:hypothetical protein